MIRSPASNLYEPPRSRKRFCGPALARLPRANGEWRVASGGLLSSPLLAIRHSLLAAHHHATAAITRATRANRSAISLSLMISGGDSAMVSPLTRITRFSVWNAFTIAS